jgi:hypothetical protein
VPLGCRRGGFILRGLVGHKGWGLNLP